MWKTFILFSDDPETLLRALSLPRLVYMEKIHVANITASHMNIDLVKNLFCKIGKHSCHEISWENCDPTFVSAREVSKALFQKKVLAFKDTKFRFVQVKGLLKKLSLNSFSDVQYERIMFFVDSII